MNERVKKRECEEYRQISRKLKCEKKATAK